MPLPVAHALVGATIAVAVLPREMPRRLRAIALAAALAVAPDLDFSAPWLLDLEHDWHRGFTHSVFFALIVTALIHAYYKAARWRETLSAGLALLSHGLLDSVTTASDRGVALLWPFSSQRISLGWFPIDGYFIGNDALYDNVLRMFLELAQELIIFLPFLLLALLVRRRAR
jgi:inner membrane protein